MGKIVGEILVGRFTDEGSSIIFNKSTKIDSEFSPKLEVGSGELSEEGILNGVGEIELKKEDSLFFIKIFSILFRNFSLESWVKISIFVSFNSSK